MLDITMSTEKGMEATLAGNEDAPFQTILDRYSKIQRLRPDFKKVVPLFAQWRRMAGLRCACLGGTSDASCATCAARGGFRFLAQLSDIKGLLFCPLEFRSR